MEQNYDSNSSPDGKSNFMQDIFSKYYEKVEKRKTIIKEEDDEEDY